MAQKIGFRVENTAEVSSEAAATTASQEKEIIPRKSVVQVHFPGRSGTLAYYNDQFDLQCGDMVFVEGKLENLRGRVVDVNYNFKIKVFEYKRVLSVVDTDVSGQFFMAGSHFVTFDPSVLPRKKAASWFKAPETESEEYTTSSDDSAFYLDYLGNMNISNAIAERGQDYYMNNRVRYLSLEGTHGYAIVEGSKAYEVEFEYAKGEVSSLTCSCFCGYNCKHEFAVMQQLRETLGMIEQCYEAEYEKTGYFAAICKSTMFALVIENKAVGSFIL